MRPHIDEAWRSLTLADRDIVAFEVLRDNPKVHLSVICFHAQQATEKSLKAVLFSRQIEFRRTHNLVELTELLRSFGLEPPVSNERLRRLTPFAVTFRYDDMEVRVITPETATAITMAVRGWAEKQVRLVMEDEETAAIENGYVDEFL